MSSRTARQNELVAFHESGHAVSAWLQRVPISDVTIVPADDYEGRCLAGPRFFYRFRPDVHLTPHGRAKIERFAITLLSGAIAERRERGRWNTWGASADNHIAIGMAEHVVGGGKVLDKYLAYLFAAAEAQFADDRNWKAVTAVASTLLQRGTLPWPEVVAVIHESFGVRSMQVCAAEAATVAGVEAALQRSAVS